MSHDLFICPRDQVVKIQNYFGGMTAKIEIDIEDSFNHRVNTEEEILGMVDDGSFGSTEDNRLASHVLLDSGEDEGSFRDENGTVTYRFVHVAPESGDDGSVPEALTYQTAEPTSAHPAVLTNSNGGQFYVIGYPSDVLTTAPNAKAVLPRETANKTGRKRDDRRRANHNEVERRRRDKINNWISKLAKLVPATAGTSTATPANPIDTQSKGGILAKACDYIVELTDKQKRLQQVERDNDKLVMEVVKLNQELAGYKRDNTRLRDQLVENRIMPHSDRNKIDAHNS